MSGRRFTFGEAAALTYGLLLLACLLFVLYDSPALFKTIPND